MTHWKGKVWEASDVGAEMKDLFSTRNWPSHLFRISTDPFWFIGPLTGVDPSWSVQWEVLVGNQAGEGEVVPYLFTPSLCSYPDCVGWQSAPAECHSNFYAAFWALESITPTYPLRFKDPNNFHCCWLCVITHNFVNNHYQMTHSEKTRSVQAGPWLMHWAEEGPLQMHGWGLHDTSGILCWW